MFAHRIYVFRCFPVLHSPIGLPGLYNVDSFQSSAVDEDRKERRCLVRDAPSLSPRRPGFDTRPVHLKFLVDIVALGHGFFRLLHFPPAVPFHQCPIFILHLHVAVTRTNGRSLGTSQKAKSFRKSEAVGWKSTYRFLGRPKTVRT